MTEHEEIGLRKMFLRVVRGYLTEETDSIPSELIDEVAYDLSEELFLNYLAYEFEQRMDGAGAGDGGHAV